MRAESTRQWSNQQLTPACERAQVLISRHIDGELNKLDAAELRTHLSECPGCRKALEIQTSHSRELTEAFKKLWPGDAESELKKKSSNPSENWVPSRRTILRAASILLLLVAVVLIATRGKTPDDAQLPQLNTTAPANPVAVEIEQTSRKNSDVKR